MELTELTLTHHAKKYQRWDYIQPHNPCLMNKVCPISGLMSIAELYQQWPGNGVPVLVSFENNLSCKCMLMV